MITLGRISPISFQAPWVFAAQRPSELSLPFHLILTICLGLAWQVAWKRWLEGTDGGDLAPEPPHLTNLPIYSLLCFLNYQNSDFSVHLLCPPAHPLWTRMGFSGFLPGLPFLIPFFLRSVWMVTDMVWLKKIEYLWCKGSSCWSILAL